MKDFLLGAATAAHQVEGNNIYSDCWAQEQMKNSSFAEPSEDACDHYHRYEEDIRLLAEAGLNAYRFSIEWARIEPQEGKFDISETEHYQRVIRCCRENGVEPVVTLHHFSSPRWLMAKGGWESEDVPAYFARYTRYVMEKLGGELHYVCTINEANMRLQIASISEKFMKDMMARAKATANAADSSVQLGIDLEKMMASREETARENRLVFGTDEPRTFFAPCTKRGDELIMEAHRAARAVIRECAPHVKVGLTLSLHDIQAAEGGEERAGKEWDDEFRHYLPALEEDDFIGVQNYTRSLIGPEGALPNPEGARLTQSGYEYYPQALANVIKKVAKDFHGEILVTENGIATSEDEERVTFIEEATKGVADCIAEGIPVKAYFHWSLLDNFEWQKGFDMTFGLVGVDRKTQMRCPKKSLTFLGTRASLF